MNEYDRQKFVTSVYLPKYMVEDYYPYKSFNEFVLTLLMDDRLYMQELAEREDGSYKEVFFQRQRMSKKRRKHIGEMVRVSICIPRLYEISYGFKSKSAHIIALIEEREEHGKKGD